MDFTEQSATLKEEADLQNSDGVAVVEDMENEENLEEQKRQNGKFQSSFSASDLDTTGPSMEDYDYEGAFNDGNSFSTDEEGGIDLQNKNIRPATYEIAGHDAATGKRFTNDHQDSEGYIKEGIYDLQNSKVNTKSGSPNEDMVPLAKIARGVGMEYDGSYEKFSTATKGPWTEQQKITAWESNKQTDEISSDIKELGKKYQEEDTIKDLMDRYKDPSQRAEGIQENIDETELVNSPKWIQSGRTFIEHFNPNGSVAMDDAEVHDFMLNTMSSYNYNIPMMMFMAKQVTGSNDKELAQAFLFMIDQTEATKSSLPAVGRAVGGVSGDATSWLTFGGSILLTKFAGAAMKSRLRAGITKILTVAAADAAIGGTITATAEVSEQAVEMAAGEREEPDIGQVAEKAGVGAAVGATIGVAIPVALDPALRQYGVKTIKNAFNKLKSIKTDSVTGISEKEFTDAVTEFNVGRNSVDVSENVKPVDVEDVNPNLSSPDSGSKEQIGPNKLLSRKSSDIMQRRKEQATKAPSISLEDAENLVIDYEYSKNANFPIDEENLGRILNKVETSEDLKRLVDIAGTAEEKISKQTFADIAADSDVTKDLVPILTGTQEGLFTPKQQYGMRRLLATTGDRSVDLANRIAAGDHTPETLLEYQKVFSSFESIYRMARGNARETARALNQQKMMADTLSNKNIREMQKAIEMAGGDMQGEGIINSAKNLAKRVEKGESPIESMSYVLKHDLKLYTRGLVEIWKNNILSGLGTHSTNLMSVGVANTWEDLVIKPLAAGIGSIRTLGKPPGVDRVTASEIAYRAAGSMVGFRSSFKMFKDAFMSNTSAFGPGSKAEHTGALHQIASNLTGGSKVGEGLADAATVSFRLLQAEDDAMRGIVFTSELYGLAAREGRLKGLTGKALLKYADNAIENPSDEMFDMALQEAARRTFTQGDLKGAIGAMAKYSRALAGQVPALQFIMPFINTPANLLQYSMDTSIVAAVSPRLWKEVMEGGAKADMALAKMSAGASLTLGVYQLYDMGFITGSGPDDFGAKSQLEKEGWKENAIKIKNKHYSVKRLEPFSTSIAYVAEMLDKAKYAPTEEAAKEAMAHAMVSFAETAMDSAWTANINDFYEAVRDPKKWDKFQANFNASFVPYSAAVRSVEQMVDPTTRRTSNDPRVNKPWTSLAKDRIVANTPFLSETLRPGRYWDGTVKIPDQGGFAFAISPVKTGTVGKGDMANRELIRNGVVASEPPPIVNVGYTSFSLLDITGGNDRLYDDYLVRVGMARREILDKVVSSSKYAKLSEGPNGERFAILQQALSMAKRKGLKDFFDNTMINAFDQDPVLMTRAEQIFMADPKLFVKGLSDEIGDFELGLDVKRKLTPTRLPVELPGDQSYVPRF